jgi:hypothetical protein
MLHLVGCQCQQRRHHDCEAVPTRNWRQLRIGRNAMRAADQMGRGSRCLQSAACRKQQ